MSAPVVAGLLQGLQALPGSGSEPPPWFFLLDGEGRLLFAAGDPPGGIDARLLETEAGGLEAALPEGWGAALFPTRIYEQQTGSLGVAAPLATLPAWKTVLEAVHGLETERQRREYEVEDLSQAMVRHLEEISLLAETSSDLHLGLTPREFWGKALEQMGQAVKARRGLLVLPLEGRPGYRVVCIWERQGNRVQAENPGERSEPDEARDPWLGFESEGGITGEALADRRLIAREDLVGSRTPPAPFEAQARNLLVVPLVPELGQSGEPRALGAVVLLDRSPEGSAEAHGFTSVDKNIAGLIGCQVAAQLGNRSLAEYRKEVQIAGTIQKSLLPVAAPRVAGFELAGLCEPARLVGGDYFDFFPVQGGEVGAVIADVSGHNVASALMMPMTRAALQWVAGRESEPARIVEETSSLLHRDLSAAELFLTLFLVVVRPGDGRVRMANAGHNSPLLYRSSTGQVEWVELDGPLVGLLPRPRHDPGELRLGPGDVLVLYTDGITETTNETGEMFGEGRLAEAVRRLGAGAAAEIARGLFDEVRRFGDSGQDDVTVVVIRGTE